MRTGLLLLYVIRRLTRAPLTGMMLRTEKRRKERKMK